ncbi:MAG: ABC transporter substrate-binding protein [bacterium]
MARFQRIVSLLPGLTDTLFALSLGEHLCGISHECDLPEGWPGLPRLTRCRFDDNLASHAIDETVRTHSGTDLYELDTETLAALRPDLILTQSQCDVCAISEKTVVSVAQSLPGHPHVFSVNPLDLAGVMQMFRDLGELLDRSAETRALCNLFTAQATHQPESAQVNTPEKLKVAHLEWLDPAMGSGHWNPDLFRLAGLTEQTGTAGCLSEVISSERLESILADADALVLGLCGFSVERTRHELGLLPPDHPVLRLITQYNLKVYALDGHRLMVRPGPLLLTSLECLKKLFQPGGFSPLPEQIGQLPIRPLADDAGELQTGSAGWIIQGRA